MGRCKRWTSEELGALAVAYINATSNAIKGTDQTKDDSVKDILDWLAKLAPPESEFDKTYHHWGKNAYYYL